MEGGQPIWLIDWDAVFARVCRVTGWTWDQAESQLDLHRLAAINRELERVPLVDALVAAYLGYESPVVDAADEQPADESFDQFEALFSAAGGRVG